VLKSKLNARLWMMLCAAIVFSNCATTRQDDSPQNDPPQNELPQYHFSLRDTLAIFLLQNEKDFYFCIPVQYIGDYHISSFKFTNGNITIGDNDIVLKRDDLSIVVYLNESADKKGNTVGDFNLIYQEKNGEVLVSKLAEPLTMKNKPEFLMNRYDIFIERYLTDNEMKNIINKYEKGNVYSKMSIWYDLVIDNEKQNGKGLLDDFELYNGPGIDRDWFPSSLKFFTDKYLN